jgi:phage baseplate assembly protein W
VIKISRDPIAALNDVDSFLDKAKQLYKDVQELIDKVALLKAKSLELRTRYNKFLTQTTKILTSPLDIVKNFIDISFATAGIAYDTYQAGKYTEKRYIESSELIRATLNEGLKIYGYQISEGWQTSKIVSIEADAGLSTPEDIIDPISRNVDLKDYEFNGLNVYTIKGEDTLQSIALSEMGDEDLWVYIAAVNGGLYSNNDLVPGNTIYIPVQIETSEAINKEQFIMTEDIIRDPYGTDILLDANGGIVVQENSDVALVSGIENVQQAINLKLQTTAGSMIKQSAYGIIAQAGFAGETMALRYMKMAIRAALIQDPRIEAIRNLFVTLESDVVYVSMDIDIYGAEASLPVSVSM